MDGIGIPSIRVSPGRLGRSPQPVFDTTEVFARKPQREASSRMDTLNDGEHTPSRSLEPPPPPSKSSTPVSRVFSQPPGYRSTSPRHILVSPSSGSPSTRAAAAMSTLESLLDSASSEGSPLYNPDDPASYFDQCFDVKGKLGGGAFGDVFKVVDRTTGQTCAIKVSRAHARGFGDLHRKLREVHAALALSTDGATDSDVLHHPNCLAFYACWEQDGRLFIQTELCEGSLDSYVTREHNNAPLPEDLVWTMMADLAMGLDHIHSRGLLHLDIKPANILVALDGHTLKYGDFGIAQQQEPSDDEHNYSTQQTQSHYNQQQHSDDDDAFAALNSSRVSNEDSMRFAEEGDPRYLAPELLSGVYTRAADIFSLGMTLLELATGLDLPNHGSLWTRLRKPRPLDAIPPEFLTGMSDELREILTRMLDSNMHARVPIRTVLETERIAAQIEPMASGGWRRKGTGQWAVTLAAQRAVQCVCQACRRIWLRWFSRSGYKSHPVARQQRSATTTASTHSSIASYASRGGAPVATSSPGFRTAPSPLDAKRVRPFNAFEGFADDDDDDEDGDNDDGAAFDDDIDVSYFRRRNSNPPSPPAGRPSPRARDTSPGRRMREPMLGAHARPRNLLMRFEEADDD